MSLLATLVSPVLSLFGARGVAKHEEIKAEQEQEKLETEVEHEETVALITGRDAYDLEALKQKGKTYLDEYYGYMLGVPIMASFIPFLQPYVANGWVIIATVPLWYQTVLIGILASTFGLRFLFDKKGN
jgi:hypothetical protein